MSVPAQQKALRLQSHAGPYAVDTVAIPSLAPGEVLVRVEAAALNPSDWKTRFTEYSFVLRLGGKYPAKQGGDIAGTVARLGEGVTTLAVGDKVFHQGFYSDKLAGFQHYTAVAANLVAKLPDNLTLDQAATIPLALVTAIVGFYQAKYPVGGGAALTPFWKDGGRGKYAGQPVLIYGGSSAVGQYAIQAAKLSGFSPIITTVSPKHNVLVASLGATHAVDRDLSPAALTDAIRAVTKDIRLVYDAISDVDTMNHGYDVLAPGGTLVIVLKDQVDEAKKTEYKVIINTYGSPHFGEGNMELGMEVYKHVYEWFQSGELKPTEAEYVPGGLDAVAREQERLRAGTVGARKLIVHPQETA